MANYIARCRTNYFKVTDEEKYRELFLRLIGDETEVEDFTVVENGITMHGFGCMSTIYFKTDDADEDEPSNEFESFLQELQPILPDGEAFIFTECGHQKLNHVSGYVTVVTKDEIKHLALGTLALILAREMLGNPNFETRMEY